MKSIERNVFALQPYYVGSKHWKSLAIVIPSSVAKKYNINPSTIFTLKIDDDNIMITLKNVHVLRN